jgi:hypothetical protein
MHLPYALRHKVHKTINKECSPKLKLWKNIKKRLPMSKAEKKGLR